MQDTKGADVKIYAEYLESKECTCDMCHKSGNVTKLIFPITSYDKAQSQYKQMRRQIWMCDKCKNMVICALIDAHE